MRINHVTHNISRDNVEAARSFYSDSLGLGRFQRLSTRPENG